MSVSQIYISCPMLEPIGQLKQVANVCFKYADLADILFRVTYWDREQYFKSDLDEADIFILMLPGNAWEYPIGALPVGCRKELDIARKANKKIFIAYKNKAGEYNIYSSNIYYSQSCEMIQGLTGSTTSLYNCLKLLKSENAEPVETKYVDPYLDPNSPIHYMNIEEIANRYGFKLADKTKDLIDVVSNLAKSIQSTDRRLLFKLKKR